MTNEDQIVALFARANPVPSLDLLDPVEAWDMERLAQLSARSSEMTEVETIELRPEGPSRRPRLALTVAMTVIAVVALGVLVNRESGVASPLSVANAFMDALAEHDGNAALGLFSPDGTFGDKYPSNLPIVAEWDRAVGWQEISQGCEEISTDSAGTLVACPFIRQTDWILALGLEPVTNNIYAILVDKGQIQSVVETDNGEVSRDGMIEASQTFRAWVIANHPDDMATMYKNGDSWQAEDPESIALYEQYTDEFVAYMASPESVARAFMGALNTHDGNAAAALMAPDGLYDGDEPSMIPGWFDYDRAIGSAYTFHECVETSSGPDGTVVECPILQNDDRTRVLGIEPMPGRYEFLVEEGQIHSADLYLDNGDDAARAWQAFDAWLRVNHNLDLTTMYSTAGVPERTPEALVLWEQYTDEFVASLEG